MSTLINSRTVYATVGNMSYSGSLVTMKFMCAKGDAAAVYLN
jgi:hypothetical protein